MMTTKIVSAFFRTYSISFMLNGFELDNGANI